MRRLRLAMGVGILLLATRVPVEAAPDWSREWLETELSAALGGKVAIGSIAVDLIRLRVDVRDVRVEIPNPAGPPLRADVASGRLQLAWSGVVGLGSGRIRVTELVLDRPEIQLDASFLERPARPPSERRFDWQIGRVEVRDGRFRFVGATGRVGVDVSEVSVLGSWDAYRQALTGVVRARAALEQATFEGPYVFTASAGFRFASRRLELFRVVAEGAGLHAELAASLAFAGGFTLSGEGEVRANLDELGRRLRASFPPIRGRLEGNLRFGAGGLPAVVRGTVHATAASIGPLSIEGGDAALAIRGGMLELRDLRANAFGGRVAGSVDVSLSAPTRFTAAIRGEEVEAARLIALGGLHLPFAAHGPVEVRLEGEAARVATWTGEGTMRARSRAGAAGEIPADASATITFATGRLALAIPEATLASTRLALSLELDLARSPFSGTLALEGTSEDAAATRDGTVRILEALSIPVPAILREDLAGHGRIAARVGIGGPADVDVGLDLLEGRFAREPFSTAALALRLRGDDLTIERLAAEGAGASIDGTARVDLARNRLLAIDARGEGVDVARLVTRFEIPVRLTGRLAGRFRAGVDAAGVLRGEGDLAWTEGTVEGEEVERATARASLAGDTLTLSGLTSEGPSIDAAAEVVIDLPTRSAAIDLASATVAVGRLEVLRAAAVEAEGILRLAGKFTFVVGRGPSGTLSVEGESLALLHGGFGIDRVDVGRATGEAELSERGVRAALEGHDATAWTFEGTLGWERRAPLRAHLRFGEIGASWKGGLKHPLALTLSGELRADGDLADPRAMRVDGTFERLAIRVGPRDLAAVAAVPISLQGRRLALGPAVLEGSETRTRLAVRLGVDLETSALDAALDGSLDLTAATLFWPDLRASGMLESKVTIGGTLDHPDFRGRMAIREGRLRVLGFPQVFDQLEADLSHEGRVVRIENLRAVSGGGEIRGGGDFELDGWKPSRIDATVEIAGVQVRYPEGFRGVYDGGLFLHGSGTTLTLGGRLEMLEGQYVKDFELLSALGFGGRRWTPQAEASAPKSVLLDVDLAADGNLWLRNNLGKIEGRLDLHLGGSLAKPELTGRVNLYEGGTIRFQDVDYRILSGSIDLVDRTRIAPYLDLRGETKVENYEILLQIQGTVDRFEYDLTSNPPLSEQDIIGLLLTGSTLESLNTATPSGAGAVTGDVATNYFAGLLSARLTNQVRQALGLERFEINPLLIEGQADPTARVTIGKEVTRGLRVLLSYDIGSTERQLYQVEWQASRRFRISAERDTTGGIGGDVVYRDRYYTNRQHPVAPAAPVPAPPSGPPVGSITIEGADPREEPILRRAVPFAPGAPYSRPKLYEGADAIRRLYVTSGRIEARVRSETDGGDDGMRIVYRVEPGPWVRVEIGGIRGKLLRRIEKKLRGLWAESGGGSDLYGIGEDLIRSELSARGYFAAEVTRSIEDGDETRIVRYRIDPGKPVKIEAIRFEGAAAIPPSTLRGLMLTRTTKALKRGVLDPALLDEDIEVIRRYYDAEGFPRASVDPPVIRLSVRGDGAEILIPIREGPRFRFGALTVPGDLPFPADTLLSWIGLHGGDAFSRAALVDAEARLRSRFDAAGYPEVRVDSEVVVGEATADVAFRVEPGPLMRIGAIEIVGNDRTRDKVLRRDLAFSLGEPLSGAHLLETQRRLYRLGLFTSVRLENLPLDGEDPVERKVRVRVVEGPPIGFNFGLGYSTEAKLRTTFSVSDDNVGGYGQSVAFQGRLSAIDKRLQLVVKEHRLFNRKVDGLLALVAEHEEEVGFTVDRRSAALRVDWKPARHWNQFVRYTYQLVETSDIVNVQELIDQKLSPGRLGLGDLAYAAIRDSRDDPFQPTRGGYAGVELRLFAKPLLSEATFGKAFFQGSVNKPLGRGTGYGAALRLGLAWPFGATERVPLSERFFAGGDSTIRGYSRDTVGPGIDPLSAQSCQAWEPGCQPIGGEALFLLNQEFTFPIWSLVRGVLFVDAGTAWRTPASMSLADIRSSVGVGIRLVTPIGPIRLEYGQKIDRQAGESAGEVLIGIGSWF